MLTIEYRSFIGTICLMTVPIETMGQKVGLVISYYITLSFWSAQTLALSMMSRNIAGQTKKSVVVALNFIIWSTGNAIGKSPHPSPFPKHKEPKETKEGQKKRNMGKRRTGTEREERKLVGWRKE
jgi:hypothetical protein